MVNMVNNYNLDLFSKDVQEVMFTDGVWKCKVMPEYDWEGGWYEQLDEDKGEFYPPFENASDFIADNAEYLEYEFVSAVRFYIDKTEIRLLLVDFKPWAWDKGYVFFVCVHPESEDLLDFLVDYVTEHKYSELVKEESSEENMNDNKYRTFGDILTEVKENGYVLNFDTFSIDYYLENPLFVITDSKERMCEYVMKRAGEVGDFLADIGVLTILVVNKEACDVIKYTNGPSLKGTDFYYIDDNQHADFDVELSQDVDDYGHPYIDGYKNISSPDPKDLKVIYSSHENIVECFKELSESKKICLDISDSELLYCVSYVLARCRKKFYYASRCHDNALRAFSCAIAGLASTRGADIPEKNEMRIKRLDAGKIDKLNQNQVKQLTFDFDRYTTENVIRQGKTIEEQERIYQCIKTSYDQLLNWKEIPFNKEQENLLDDLYIDILAGEFIGDNEEDIDVSSQILDVANQRVSDLENKLSETMAQDKSVILKLKQKIEELESTVEISSSKGSISASDLIILFDGINTLINESARNYNIVQLSTEQRNKEEWSRAISLLLGSKQKSVENCINKILGEKSNETYNKNRANEVVEWIRPVLPELARIITRNYDLDG